jgi:hypothetical protein
MKGGVRRSAVFHRIRKRFNHLLVLDDRARPAVQQQQRRGIGDFGSLMDEMDVETVDVRLELCEPIEVPFL